ncbi:hypothetical protein BOTCAL_0314g00110 [Botryotinia calthae]|uniref:Uncharacterized protein n=1 Tax=Botryotinia calthae TaxID=38488 RepID=A0A4Y8CW62_9HELO|nr:hypothetical protein BOTCAL_0314g00110 [Botryotinia calthae]
MDQPQDRKYCFQTRIFMKSRSNAAYIPGMPAMLAPQPFKIETVDEYVKRYNVNKIGWEDSVREGRNVDLHATKANLYELDSLKIPEGVNQDSWIKPSEDWRKEHPDKYILWGTMIESLAEGTEIIEAEVLSDAFMNDPPTFGNGPGQPVLPPSRAQQNVQPFPNTAGPLLAKRNSTFDLQGRSRLNDDSTNPSTSSGISQPSIKNRDSQLSPQPNGNQQIVYPVTKTAGYSSATSVQINDPLSRSILNGDHVNRDPSFLVPPQTPVGNSDPSSTTPDATNGPISAGNSSLNGGIN